MLWFGEMNCRRCRKRQSEGQQTHVSTCKIPNCEQPAVINAAYAADGARCYEHSAIGQWIPCSVAMPTLGLSVLAKHMDGTNIVLSWNGNFDEWRDGYLYEYRRAEITHWMRIPGGP